MSDATEYGSVIWRRGKKTILRPRIESDLTDFNIWINDPNSTKNLGVTWPVSEIAQRDWYKHTTESDLDDIVVSICTLEGKLIGNMSMKINLRKQSAVTGSFIGQPDYRSKGFGTDAKMLMLDYAFNWRGLRKVTSCIFSFNGRSQSYAKKCGYRHMATIEKEHFRNGEWCDEELFVVFSDEWLPLWEEYCSDWTPDWVET